MRKSKLSELVLYIATKSKDDDNFGSTKLNKILFYADFFYYGLTGKSISDSVYQHIQFGPAPKAMKPVLDELKESGRAKIEKVQFFSYPQDKVIPLAGYDLSLFTEEEIQFIDYWINHFRDQNATDLTKETHEQNSWLLTSHKEEIPYNTVFVLKDWPVEIDGHIWAKNKLKELRKRGYAH